MGDAVAAFKKSAGGRSDPSCLGVPVLEFRASIVIGSGSLSFEMIRSLVERLPIMITPKWVSSPAQPIAIDDLLAYLTKALFLPVTANRIFEIEEQTRSLTLGSCAHTLVNGGCAFA